MNKTTGISILVALIIGVILGSQIGCKNGKEGQTIKTDTLIHFIPQHDTTYKTITLHDEPSVIWGHDTIIAHDYVKIQNHDTFHIPYYTFITDTALYRDTLRQANEYKAILIDTVAGNRIIGRSLFWENLTPDKVIEITKTKKPSIVKVFLGAGATIPVSNITASRFDFTPAIGVLISDKYLAEAQYGLFGQTVNVGLKVKLQFHK